MTKEQFIDGYCKRSGITRGFYDSNFVALRCDCGEDNCSGWAAVGNNEEQIRRHLELYGGRNEHN